MASSISPSTTRARGRPSYSASSSTRDLISACDSRLRVRVRTDMAVLRIPQPQAEQQLNQRIEIGQDLMRHVKDPLISTARGSHQIPIAPEELDETWRQAMPWHAFNQTWIDTNLGGAASAEFSRQSYAFQSSETDRPVRYELLRQNLRREVSLLESIRDRMPLWVPAPETTATTGPAARSSPDGPIVIVHGGEIWHAGAVARTVAEATGCESVIIHEEPDLGRT